MNKETLTELQQIAVKGQQARIDIKAYVQTIFEQINRIYKIHQDIIDDEFPQHWSGTVHGDDHLVQLFDSFDSYSINNTLLKIRTWECFRSEYDYKDEEFPVEWFYETNNEVREILIHKFFQDKVEGKRRLYKLRDETP